MRRARGKGRLYVIQPSKTFFLVYCLQLHLLSCIRSIGAPVMRHILTWYRMDRPCAGAGSRPPMGSPTQPRLQGKDAGRDASTGRGNSLHTGTVAWACAPNMRGRDLTARLTLACRSCNMSRSQMTKGPHQRTLGLTKRMGPAVQPDHMGFGHLIEAVCPSAQRFSGSFSTYIRYLLAILSPFCHPHSLQRRCATLCIVRTKRSLLFASAGWQIEARFQPQGLTRQNSPVVIPAREPLGQI